MTRIATCWRLAIFTVSSAAHAVTSGGLFSSRPASLSALEALSKTPSAPASAPTAPPDRPRRRRRASCGGRGIVEEFLHLLRRRAHVPEPQRRLVLAGLVVEP